MSSEIKFVYFDIGGVFLDWKDVFQTAARDNNVGFDNLVMFFDENEMDITKGKMTPDDFWRLCARKFDLKNAENYPFIDSWVGDFKAISEMYSFANEIFKSYEVGIISNLYNGMYDRLVKKKIVPDWKNDRVIISADVGMMKPEEGIYLLAEERCGYSGNEILFIDDSEKYLGMAGDLGWQTFLFETYNHEKSVDELRKLLL